VAIHLFILGLFFCGAGLGLYGSGAGIGNGTGGARGNGDRLATFVTVSLEELSSEPSQSITTSATATLLTAPFLTARLAAQGAIAGDDLQPSVIQELQPELLRVSNAVSTPNFFIPQPKQRAKQVSVKTSSVQPQPRQETKAVNARLVNSASHSTIAASSASDHPLIVGQGAGTGDGDPTGSGGEGGSGIGLLSSRARVVSAPKPPYPAAARRIGFEGRVVLDLVIDPSGSVRDASVHKSSGRIDCDLAARNTALQRWRFAPAMKNGELVSTTERVAVVYRISQDSSQG